MENYQISIGLDKQIHQFEVGEYPHHNGEGCKVKVFQQGKLLASFEPDAHNYLQICSHEFSCASGTARFDFHLPMEL